MAVVPAQTPAQLAAAEAAAGLNSTQVADVASGTPYTPAEVSAAQSTTTPTPSPFSSSNAVVSGIQASTAASTAGSALSTPAAAPAAPTSISIGGANYQISNGQFQMPNTQAGAAPGSTTTYQTSSTPPAPGVVPAGEPYQQDPTTGLYYWALPASSSSGSASISAPAGYTLSTPDSSGNQTVSGGNYASYNINPSLVAQNINPNGNAQQLATQYVQNMPGVQSAVAALGTGYSMTTDAGGTVTVNGPNGASISLGPSTVASGEGVGDLNTWSTGIATANSALQSTLSTLAAEHQQTLDQLNEEMLAAQQEEGATQGVVGGGTSGATSYFQNLIDEENSNYESQVAAAQTQNQQAIETATANAQSALDSIDEKAQVALQSSASSAMTQFNTSAASNYLGLTLPTNTATGQPFSWSDIANNPQAALAAGLGNNPTLAGAIQQGVTAGLTPAQALGQIATAQLSNQKTAYSNFSSWLSTLNPAITSGMSTQQIMAQYGYGYQLAQTAGMSQSDFITAVQNGTLTAQKQSFTETGTVPGLPGPVPATAQNPSFTLSATDANTPGLANSIAAGTKYSPNAIYQAALEYALTGAQPSLGLGTAAQVQNARASVLNVAGAIASAAGTTLPELQAEYSANEDSLTTILPQANTTILNATNATTNFNNLVSLSQNMDASTPTLAIPILEKWLQTGQVEAGGNQQVNDYVSYLTTSLTEYAKVVTGQNSGAGVTQFANEEAQGLLNAGLSASAVQNWVSTVAQPAMSSRVNASIGQVNTISSTIGDLLQVTASGVTSGQALNTPATVGNGGSGGGSQPTAPSGYTIDANGNYVNQSTGQVYQQNQNGTFTLIGNSGYSLGNSDSASAWPGFTTSQ